MPRSVFFVLVLCFAVPVAAQPIFELSVDDQTVQYDPAFGTGSFSADLFLAEDPASPGYPNETVAFTITLAHDYDLLAALGADLLPPLANLNDGDGPDFCVCIDYPGQGFHFGVIYQFVPTGPGLFFPQPTAIARIHYETIPAVFEGNEGGSVTALQWVTLQNPFIENVIIIDPAEDYAPQTVDGEITLDPTRFVRGDDNTDGIIGLADPIFNLTYQFIGGSAHCLEALDTDGSGDLTINDPLLNLYYINGLGPPPAPPFPNCGTAPVGTLLGCESSGACL